MLDSVRHLPQRGFDKINFEHDWMNYLKSTRVLESTVYSRPSEHVLKSARPAIAVGSRPSFEVRSPLLPPVHLRSPLRPRQRIPESHHLTARSPLNVCKGLIHLFLLVLGAENCSRRHRLPLRLCCQESIKGPDVRARAHCMKLSHSTHNARSFSTPGGSPADRHPLTQVGKISRRMAVRCSAARSALSPGISSS